MCLDFKPTASDGVYVSIDAGTKGASQNATPGQEGGPLGDWMIRATVDRRVDADSLGDRAKQAVPPVAPSSSRS